MTSRRQFLRSVSVASLGSVLSIGAASTSLSATKTQGRGIPALDMKDTEILRHTRMTGDNWHMTWSYDGLQYCSMCDGYGQLDEPAGVYNSRLVAIEGMPHQINFRDCPRYPELLSSDTAPRYYNFGVLALDRAIYQFLSTWDQPVGSVGASNIRFVGVKAIYSPDDGQTWFNQDGSTPVIWEDWGKRQRGTTMLFLQEPQDAFSILSVLQMGRNYSQNRDGYIYIYAPNGNTEGTMNELVMFRVPKTRILDRSSYEYFAGTSLSKQPAWSKNIEERAPVHRFPAGWVNYRLHPWAWVPSLTYNAPLGLYMMANWASGVGPAPEALWFHTPSYLGFWISEHPWGPWVQIYETEAWLPEEDASSRCYSPIIAPKWVSADGKSFWLVWTDFQQKLTEETRKVKSRSIMDLPEKQRARARADLFRLNRPYYSFNVQRVDLNVG